MHSKVHPHNTVLFIIIVYREEVCIIISIIQENILNIVLVVIYSDQN